MINNYQGIYQGFVTSDKDPKQLGRIRVDIIGISETPLDIGWVFPGTQIMGNMNSGEFKIPPTGSIVLIAFVGGKFEEPIYLGSYPKYIEKDKKSSIPEEVMTTLDDNNNKIKDYNPRNYIYKSDKGSKIYICDDDYNEHIEIKDPSGAGIVISSPLNKKIRDKYNVPLDNAKTLKWNDLETGSTIRLHSKDYDSFIELFSTGIEGQGHIKLKSDNISFITKNGKMEINNTGDMVCDVVNQKTKVKKSMETNAGTTTLKSNSSKIMATDKIENISNVARNTVLQENNTLSSCDYTMAVTPDKSIKLIVGASPELFKIEMNNEKITISSKTVETKIELKNTSIEIKDQFNNNILLDTNGVSIKDKTNNEIKTTSTGINIKDITNNEVKMTSGGIELASNVLIKMGNGTQSYVKLIDLLGVFTSLTQQFNLHTHSVAGPSTLVPTVPLLLNTSTLGSTKIIGE